MIFFSNRNHISITVISLNVGGFNKGNRFYIRTRISVHLVRSIRDSALFAKQNLIWQPDKQSTTNLDIIQNLPSTCATPRTTIFDSKSR